MLFKFLKNTFKSIPTAAQRQKPETEPDPKPEKPRRSKRYADYLGTKRIELIHSDTGTREPIVFYFCPLPRLLSCLDIRLYKVGSNSVIKDIVGCGLYYYVDGKRYNLP